MIRLIRRHVIICILSRDFGLDRQQISNRVYDGFGDVSDTRSKLLDESVKQVPRPSLDTHMVVVDQSHEILQDLGDVLGMGLKNSTVSDADFHVLEKNCRMREVCDSCS